MEKFKCNKKYQRTPIILSPHTVAVVHLFTRHDHLDDLWMTDCDYDPNNWEQAAKQLIAQFERKVSRSFLKALIAEAQKKLESFNSPD